MSAARGKRARAPDGSTATSEPDIAPALLRLAEVCRYVSVGKTRLYELMGEERQPFPQPLRLGKRHRCWRRSEIDQWIEERARQQASGSKRERKARAPMG